MIRKSKVLGSLIAVVALSAFAASAAQANFTSAAYPATLTATSTKDVFDAFGGEVKCTNNSFSGSLSAASSTLTITPSYKNCTAFGFLPATVNRTSCDFVFHTTTLSGFKEVDVECTSPGDAIDITVWASNSAHTEGKAAICHLRIPQQTGLRGFTLTNTSGVGKVDLSGTVEGITATQVRNSFLCPAGEHTSTAKYTIEPGSSIAISGNNGAISVD